MLTRMIVISHRERISRNLRNICSAENSMSKAKKSKGDNKKNIVPKEDMCSPITEDKIGNILLKISAKPGAKLNSITDISEEGIGIQINAPPLDGEANIELVRYLTDVLGVRKSDVSLEKGSRSRQKVIMISKGVLKKEEILIKLKEILSNR